MAFLPKSFKVIEKRPQPNVSNQKSIESDMIYQTEFMDMMIQEAICDTNHYDTGMDDFAVADGTNSDAAQTITLDDYDINE